MKIKFIFVSVFFLLAFFSLFACSLIFKKESISLSERYKDHFHVGVALSNYDLDSDLIKNIVLKEFNSITHEFAMKWSSLVPENDYYDFSKADKFVDFGTDNSLKVIGHTLVWYKSNPSELFEFRLNETTSTRDFYLGILKNHIFKVMERYQGKVHGWDVVNEAYLHDGTLRDSPWLRLIGDDYIEKAFEFAHQADPSVELYYNDFGLESRLKQDAVIKLIKRLRSKDIPIHAVGVQGHYSLNYPEIEKINAMISRFSEISIPVMFTELDVSVLPLPEDEMHNEVFYKNSEKYRHLDPYSEELPEDIYTELTERYLNLFCVFLKNKNSISRVTFWGLSDSRSWRNDWPILGRKDYPLLYDREYKRKSIVEEILELPSDYDNRCGDLTFN